MVATPSLLWLLLLANDEGAPERIEQKSRLVERMAELHVPGVSVAVVRNSKLAWAKGYGVRVAGGSDRVDASTMFQAASISKPVAAIAAMHMSQYGNFTLDENVNAKLKSWKIPGVETVTLREILSHSAGLTVHGFRGYAAGEPVPTVVQILNGEPPANSKPVVVDVTPGSIWRYSGGGYTVLQELMTDRFAGSKTFPQIMSMIVLNGLGMKNSTYEQPLPPAFHAQAAHGHDKDGREIKGGWHTYPEMAAAGLWTTPSDLARVAIEMYKAVKGESNRILEQKTAAQMLQVQKGNYGLGWQVMNGGSGFVHGGSNEGFKCLLFAPGGGDAIIIMTNGDQGAKLMQEIEQAATAEYGWKVPKP